MLEILLIILSFISIVKLLKLNEDGLFGLIISYMLGFLLYIIITPYPQSKWNTYKKLNLINIRNEDNIEGGYFLFSGSVNEKNYYYYYYKTNDGGYKQDKILTEDVTIYENDSITPHIEWLKSQMYLSWTKRPWLYFTKIPQTKIKIYIPKNSIYRGFKLK